MTREFINKYWNEIVAFKEGKEVEWRHPNGLNCWYQLADLKDIHEAFELRIKPKPLEGWLRLYANGMKSELCWREIDVPPHQPGSRLVHVVEAP